MAEHVRSLVMVENETYELIDGDGNFYVSKTNLGPISPTFPSGDPFVSMTSTEYHETFTTISDSQIAQVNNQLALQLPSVVPPQANLEPILINDYGKMNFFTQGASNVTIYLNSDNGGSFISDEYVQNSNDVIDLTTNGLDDSLRKIEHNTEQDMPEFIDLSQLKLPYPPQDCFYEFTPVKADPLNVKIENSASSSNVLEIEDDDVVFVKEYKIDGDLKVEDSAPLDLRNKETMGKTTPGPRRNPKRTVQLLKEYYNSFKFSPDNYGKGKRRRDYCDTKKSQRSGILSAPSLVHNNEHFKEWPTEGMHEKPVYNAASKKLEKFEKKKVTIRKTVKENVKRKALKKGKRRMSKAAKKREEIAEQGLNKAFATLTHETLQDVISYVRSVAEFNNIIKSGERNDDNVEDGDKVEACAEELESIPKNAVVPDKLDVDDLSGKSLSSAEKNLVDATELLMNSCILYSIANNVPQSSVAKYLKTIKNDLEI